MKYLITILLFSILTTAGARNYYVSTTGSDANTGDIDRPFRNWKKLNEIGLQPGDTAFIRGGTYRTTGNAATSNHLTWSNINGNFANRIVIMNYSGETPIFNLDNITPTYPDPTILQVQNCSYLTIKGLTFTGLVQIPSGAGVSRGINIYQSTFCRFDQVSLGNIGGYGYILDNGANDNVFYNCDAYKMGDPYSTDGGAWGNANGFQATGNSTATRDSFFYCRAWLISDDGYDFYHVSGKFYLYGCWAFNNGYEPDNPTTPAGDGDGFKLGGDNGGIPTENLRTLVNCFSANNKQHGFNRNTGQMQYTLYNNTAAYNGQKGFMWDYSPQTTCISKNNLAYGNAVAYAGTSIAGSFNSWNFGGTVNNSDFTSVTYSLATLSAARNADGSLPVISYMHLASTSDLINAGTNVGYPYYGSAPDIGAFEYAAAPTANAGTDQSVTLPTNVTLSGSYTASAIPVSIQWSQVSGAATIISNTSSLTTTVTGLSAGAFVYQLQITDALGNFATDNVQITASNPTPVAPTCSGNTSATITLPTNQAALTVTATGNAGATIVSYSWVKTSGGSATITSPTSQNTNATGLTTGTYVFTCTVTDNNGLTCQKTTTITVQAAPTPPTVTAGSDITITLPTNSTILTCTASGGSGTITSYQWSKINGSTVTIAAPTSQNTGVSNMVQSIYQFEIKVTASTGLVAKDTITVTVLPAANIPPTANAGADQTVTLPTNATLSGSGTDVDGTIVSYTWRKLTGGAVTIASPNSPITQITGLVAGVYTFELQVVDNNGAKGADTTQVTVNAAPNIPPSANAGVDKTITLPTNFVVLVGVGTDPDGTIVSYAWTKLSGTGGTFTNASASTTNFTGLVAGTYLVKLTVTDNNGATGSDTVQITVNNANVPPSVNAGADQTLRLPTSSTTVAGSVVVAQGTLSSVLWQQVSGAAATITSPTSLTTTITGLTQGTYIFSLTATDSYSLSASDTMVIQVFGENQNTNIIFFQGAYNGNKINIDWTVNSVLNTKTFAISRKWLGLFYVQQKIINPQTGVLTYKWTDTRPQSGTNKYKLTVTDKDSKTSTLEISIRKGGVSSISNNDSIIL